MSATVANALLPVVLTLLLGYIAGWHHDADAKFAAVLNNITLQYALPLALFTGTVSNNREQLMEEQPLAITLIVGLVAPYVITLLLARFVFRRDLAQSTMWALVLGSPSTSFTGLPILSAVVGSKGPVAVAVAGLVANTLITPATLVLLSIATAKPTAHGQSSDYSTGLGPILRRSLLQPIVIAPLVAILFVMKGLHVPQSLTHSMNLLGAASAGMSLFASGIVLQAQKPKLTWPVTILSLARTVVVPALTLLALTRLAVPPDIRQQAVIALGTPAGTVQIIFSVRYCVAERENASLLLFTNLASLATLATFISLLQ
jgi:malonate transporter and related proteins